MKIYLLRHGETPWNKERRLQGIQDIPMTPNGAQQYVRQADTWLIQMSSLMPYSAVPCSGQEKAQDLLPKNWDFPLTRLL